LELNGIYTGGGDVYIRARTNSSFGIVLYQGIEIFSGTGVIDIEGTSTNAGSSYGVAFIDPGGWPGHTAGPLNFVSAATASPAVKIHGVTAGSGQGVRLWGSSANNILTLASTATTGGGVDLYGQAASSYDVHLLRAQILSRNGAITLSSNVNYFGIDYGQAGNNNFGSSPTSPYVTTSSANITILMNLWDFDDPNTFFRTTGDVTIVPKTGNFFGQNPAFSFNTDGIRNLTIGRNPLVGDTSRDISLTGTHTVSGNITFNGGNVFVNKDMTSTSTSGRITLKANGYIETATGVDLRTAGGDVVFWADADASGAGNIDIDSTNTICTGWNTATSTCTLSSGGDIVMGGGTVDLFDAGLPGGAANGSGTTAPASTGLALGPCVANSATAVNNVFSTRGGNMVLRGASTTGNSSTNGVQAGVAICNGTTMNMGEGRLDISSQFRASAATYHSAFWVAPWLSSTPANSAVVINSSNSASDAIDIRAWGSNGDYTSFGLSYNNSAGGGALFELDTVFANSAAFFNFNSSGSMRIVPAISSFSSSMEIGSNFAISSSTSLFEVGTASNSSNINISAAKQIAGDVVLRGGSVSVSGAITTTGTGKRISITTDTLTISANVSATYSSRVESAQRTAGRGIVLGTASATALAFHASASNFVRATTLQFGNTASGIVNIASSITFASANITNLKIVTPTNVTRGTGAALTAPNLAIHAGGSVDLPGQNSVVGNIAISASGSVVYTSAVSYSPQISHFQILTRLIVRARTFTHDHLDHNSTTQAAKHHQT
jgi:hypothetical protein